MDDIKTKVNPTREDVAAFLKSIGKPGEKREEKMAAIRALNKYSPQNINIADSLASYEEY